VPLNEELVLGQIHGTYGGSSAPINHIPENAPWLIAINSPVAAFARRKVIRNTWLRTYQERTPFDHIFFISNPGRLASDAGAATGWAQRVARENATYGDIVVLDNIPDDPYTYKTVQPLEIFSWLARHRADCGYKFVMKLDSDVFHNVAGLWDRYVGGWINDSAAQRTLLGQRIVSERYGVSLVHTHAMMYTLGWELMARASMLYKALKLPLKEREELALAVLFTAAHEPYRVVSLTLSEAHMYWESDSRGDGTPWARPTSKPEWARHALRPQAIAVDGLLTDRLYTLIATYFDRDGPRPMPLYHDWKDKALQLRNWVLPLNWRWPLGRANSLLNPHAPAVEPELRPWESPMLIPEINGPYPVPASACDFWHWCFDIGNEATS